MSGDTHIVPAMPPPPGVQSNFVNPDTCKAIIIIIQSIFLPIAVIATVLRIWTRTVVVKSVAADDILMVVATVLSVAFTAIIGLMLRNGLGIHMWDVPFEQVSPTFNALNLASIVVYCSATGFAKVSVLAFFLRIFPGHGFQFWVYLLIVITAGYEFASCFVSIFSCSPVAKSWDLKVQGGHCINRPAFYFASAGLEIFTDLGTIGVIIPQLRPLQMPIKQKIAIGFLLATGCFAVIISCIRLSSLLELKNSTDLTWATLNGLLWCVIELNTCIAGGNFTALRPFIRRYVPCLLGLSFRSYDSGSEGRRFDVETPITLDSLKRTGKSQRNSTGSNLRGPYPARNDGGESVEDMLDSVQRKEAMVHHRQDGILRTVEYQVKS